MMKTILKKEEATPLEINSPFKVLELTVHRKDETKNLPQVKIYFSSDIEELKRLDFSNNSTFSITLKSMPKSNNTYTADVGAVVKELYKYGKVMFKETINIENEIDLYYSLDK